MDDRLRGQGREVLDINERFPGSDCRIQGALQTLQEARSRARSALLDAVRGVPVANQPGEACESVRAIRTDDSVAYRINPPRPRTPEPAWQVRREGAQISSEECHLGPTGQPYAHGRDLRTVFSYLGVRCCLGAVLLDWSEIGTGAGVASCQESLELRFLRNLHTYLCPIRRRHTKATI